MPLGKREWNRLQRFADSPGHYLIVLDEQNRYRVRLVVSLRARLAFGFPTVNTAALSLSDWFSELGKLFVPHNL